MPVAEKPSLGLVEQVKNAYAQVDKFRANLNLPNPGTYEGVNREVKSEFSGHLFTFIQYIKSHVNVHLFAWSLKKENDSGRETKLSGQENFESGANA